MALALILLIVGIVLILLGVFVEAAKKAADEVYAETSAKNETFKKVYESYAAFRADQYLWWQVAEYGFDTFMIRSRARG